MYAYRMTHSAEVIQPHQKLTDPGTDSCCQPPLRTIDVENCRAAITVLLESMITVNK